MDGNFALTHLRWGAETRSTHTHGRWQCPKQFVKVEFVENLVFLQCICNVRLSSILEFGTMGFSTWQLSLPPCISRLAWRNSVDKVLLSSVTCNFIQLWLSYLHFLASLCSNLRTAFSTIFWGEGFLNPEKLDFTSWWVSIWNLSSIHQDTEGAGKEPKAKQVKLWLWPEKRGTLATVAPNSTDNGRTEKVQHLESNIIQNLATNPYNINLGWQLWKELVTYCYCSLNKWIQCDDDVFVNFPLSWYSAIYQEWFLHRSGRLVDHLATRTPYWQATLKKTFLVQ